MVCEGWRIVERASGGVGRRALWVEMEGGL